MAITDWPVDERPRERLLQKGAQSLSDAELLAIFLRVGVKGKSAVDVSRELLQIFGGLRALLTATRDQFCAHHGMGDAKYALLQAVLEMGRRHLAEDWQRGSCLDSPQRVRQYLSASLRDRGREIFAVIFLDHRHRVLKALTRRLESAMQLLELRLLDHFIVGEGEPLSLREQGGW